MLGAPFRLYGRSVESGLDCIGVVANCLLAANFEFHHPNAYRVRGAHDEDAFAFFAQNRFWLIDDGSWIAGDILLLRPGPRQLHFAVLTMPGAVHAHMGLNRVVITPLPLPYHKIAQWRFLGE